MTLMATPKILIVEDERDINELLQYNLEKEGFDVLQAYDGQEAVELARAQAPDLIVLDIMLPEIDGRDVCRILKQDEETRRIPILMLTAKGEESDVLVGLEIGADDYVTKPFSPKVLLARVKAILRRSQSSSSGTPSHGIVRVGTLSIDPVKRRVKDRSRLIKLTSLEFNILEYLARHPGRVFSRDQIMDAAWKEGKFILDRAVDVHIRSLRKKLGQAAEYIETVHGVGYRCRDLEET